MKAEAMKVRAGELLPLAEIEMENLTGLAADFPTPYNVNRAADAHALVAILRAVAGGDATHVMEDDRNTLVIWTDLPDGTDVLVIGGGA